MILRRNSGLSDFQQICFTFFETVLNYALQIKDPSQKSKLKKNRKVNQRACLVLIEKELLRDWPLKQLCMSVCMYDKLRTIQCTKDLSQEPQVAQAR